MKSATSRVVKESSKLDLDEWLRGGKPRTKTVRLSNNPDLVEQMNALAESMNDLADQINDRQPVESEGIADDDALSGAKAQWRELKAQHDALAATYESSVMEFVFRSQRPSDPAEIEALLAEGGIEPTTETRGLALVALTCVSPAMTYDSLRGLLDSLGGDAFLPMAEAVAALAKKQEKPAAPLSLRP